MIFIVYAHFSLLLLGDNNQYFHGWPWMILDIFGPSMYLTLSCLSVSLSILNKKTNTEQTEKEILNKLLKKGLILTVLGLCFEFNYATNSIYGFFDPTYIFRMHIFQLIALCQIITFFALKLKIKFRIQAVILIVVVDYLAYPFLIGKLELGGNLSKFSSDYLFGSNSIFAWAYMLFFRADSDLSIMPWIIIPLLISIVGEYIWNNQTRNQSKLEKMNQHSLDEVIIAVGLILVASGIISGINIIPEYREFPVLDMINTGGPITLQGLFAFFFRGTVPNLIYSCGISLFFIGLLIKYIDFGTVVRKDRSNSEQRTADVNHLRKKLGNFIEDITIIGQYSLTLFITHYLFVFLEPIDLTGWIMLPVNFFLIYLNFKVILWWAKKKNAKYSFEYLIKMLVD